MSLILPPNLAPRAPVPVGLAVLVEHVTTERGVTLGVRIFDPRDPFKREHGVRVDVDTISPPKAPPSDAAPSA